MNIEPIALAKRVERWQKKLPELGIAHFEIESVSCVDETPGGSDAKATVTIEHSYDTCRFWFTWDFLEEATPAKLDTVIIHEWIHVAWRDFDVAVNAVEDWMPPASYHDWRDRLTHEREGLVERFARSLYAAHK